VRGDNVLTRRERLLFAFHEAGHCVGAEAFGLPVQRVCVFHYAQPRGDGLMAGYTERVHTDAAPIRESIGLAAGAIAEDRARATLGLPPADPVGASRDDAMSESFLRGFTPAVRARARTFAEAAVTEQWPAVEAIAAALLARSHLDGAEVRRIIARVRAVH